MTPSVWQDGGRGVSVRWTITDTDLGPLLVAATDRGICRVAFDEDAQDLARRFPNAGIEEGGGSLAAIATQVVATMKRPGNAAPLSLDVRGTAFQEAVWAELAKVPAGGTVSYAELAARAGRTGAARAVGSACGANPIAILIPCHRALRGDGTLGGYAYGVKRKQALLSREAAAD
jgi:AraC family transcriptional regulator of adaptative response/methylated-DNA-[protein]-cysteine methyltransferase